MKILIRSWEVLYFSYRRISFKHRESSLRADKLQIFQFLNLRRRVLFKHFEFQVDIFRRLICWNQGSARGLDIFQTGFLAFCMAIQYLVYSSHGFDYFLTRYIPIATDGWYQMTTLIRPSNSLCSDFHFMESFWKGFFKILLFELNPSWKVAKFGVRLQG